jgi:hypothetical protein
MGKNSVGTPRARLSSSSSSSRSSSASSSSDSSSSSCSSSSSSSSAPSDQSEKLNEVLQQQNQIQMRDRLLGGALSEHKRTNKQISWKDFVFACLGDHVTPLVRTVLHALVFICRKPRRTVESEILQADPPSLQRNRTKGKAKQKRKYTLADLGRTELGVTRDQIETLQNAGLFAVLNALDPQSFSGPLVDQVLASCFGSRLAGASKQGFETTACEESPDSVLASTRSTIRELSAILSAREASGIGEPEEIAAPLEEQQHPAEQSPKASPSLSVASPRVKRTGMNRNNDQPRKTKKAKKGTIPSPPQDTEAPSLSAVGKQALLQREVDFLDSAFQTFLRSADAMRTAYGFCTLSPDTFECLHSTIPQLISAAQYRKKQ